MHFVDLSSVLDPSTSGENSTFIPIIYDRLQLEQKRQRVMPLITILVTGNNSADSAVVSVAQ